MPPKHHHRRQEEDDGGDSYGGGGNSYGGSSGGGDSYGGSSGGGGFNMSSLMGMAQEHSGGSGDSSMFGSAMSMIQGRQGQIQQQGVDEQHLQNSHNAYYGSGGSGGEATTSGMGGAAAMQALKMFGSGSGGSSGASQSGFMGMAMGQASKLFDQQSAAGNVPSGASKESVVQEAGEQALKMYMGSSGGSSGGLMSLASKFM